MAEFGSIQGASRELGIAASAINRQILLLEELTGVKLFERHPGGMRLTSAGEMFIVMSQRWRNDVDGLQSEIEQMRGVEVGHVRLAVMDSMVNSVLPDFIAQATRLYPQVRLNLEIKSTGEAIKSLDHGVVDLALAFNVRSHRNLKIMWSDVLPMGCVVAPEHAFARRKSISLQKATEYPIALQSRTLEIRRYLEKQHQWFLFEGEHPLTTNSLQLIKRIARTGSHIAVTSELDAASEIISGSLIFIPITDVAVRSQEISLAVNNRRPVPQVVQLICDLLQKCVESTLGDVRTR